MPHALGAPRFSNVLVVLGTPRVKSFRTSVFFIEMNVNFKIRLKSK